MMFTCELMKVTWTCLESLLSWISYYGWR